MALFRAYGPYASEVEGMTPREFAFEVPPSDAPIYDFLATFGLHEGLLSYIRLDFFRLPPAFRKDLTLVDLGEPGSVLMNVEGPGTLPGGPAYELYVDYPSRSVAIGFRGDPLTRGFLCLEDREVFHTYAVLYAPGTNPSLVAFGQVAPPLYDPQEFTDLSGEAMLDILTQPDGCVQITRGY